MKFAVVVLHVTLLTLLQNAPLPPQLPPVVSPRPPAVPQQPGSVEGIVVEASSGRPLPLATVQLRTINGAGPAGILVTNTRDDGTFNFRSVPPGIFMMQAELGGYIPETYGNAPNPSYLPLQELPPGQKISGIRFSLLRGAVISGRLLDDRGEAVAGTVVQALKTTYNNGRRERKLVQSTVSNDLGEYRLFTLRRGEYFINIFPNTRVPSFVSLNNTPAAIPLYFPGTIDEKAAQAIELHESETLDNIDFSAIPTRARRITGSVQGYGDDPVGVVLSPVNGTASISKTLSPDDGVFEFLDVIPGAYMLVARTTSARSAISLDVRNADMLNLRISLSKGFRIPVHTHIEGHPAGDDPELDNVYLQVQPEIAVPGLEAEVYSPFPDGHFTLSVGSGDYQIDITRPEGAYVKSITLGGIDILNQGLHITGSTDQTMEILVASGLGALEGRTSGRESTVVLAPDAARRSRRSLFKSVRAGANGGFLFEGVPPGDYKLFALTEENGGPYLDPEYLRRYEDRGIPVHVDAGRKSTLDREVQVD